MKRGESGSVAEMEESREDEVVGGDDEDDGATAAMDMSDEDEAEEADLERSTEYSGVSVVASFNGVGRSFVNNAGLSILFARAICKIEGGNGVLSRENVMTRTDEWRRKGQYRRRRKSDIKDPQLSDRSMLMSSYCDDCVCVCLMAVSIV